MESLIVFLSRGNGVGVFDVRIPYADTVALVYFADNLRGNSRYKTIRGNVLRDNRPAATTLFSPIVMPP